MFWLRHIHLNKRTVYILFSDVPRQSTSAPHSTTWRRYSATGPRPYSLRREYQRHWPQFCQTQPFRSRRAPLDLCMRSHKGYTLLVTAQRFMHVIFLSCYLAFYNDTSKERPSLPPPSPTSITAWGQLIVFHGQPILQTQSTRLSPDKHIHDSFTLC